MNGLSKYYIRKIINCFAAEMTATATSQKLRINRNTVNKYYRIIREALADYQESLGAYTTGFKLNHIMSWNRHKGLSVSGDEGSIRFQLMEKDGKVFIKADDGQMPKGGSSANTEGTSQGQTAGEGSNWEGAAMASVAEAIQSDIDLMSVSNTVRTFFNYAKEKLAKFYGVKPEYTYLYLKELEFRFNNRNKDLGKIIWRILPHHSSKIR